MVPSCARAWFGVVEWWSGELAVAMAFEIARVHQLICSRVGDGMDVKAFNDESASVEAEQTFSWSCSPQGGHLHAHFPADLSSSFGGFEQCDGSSVPVELSSCSTETESDEDDELLQSLAQQIAHSMLDEETNVEASVGGGKGNGCSEARNLSHVEVNEGRLSPSSWSSGSWSSGSVLSGSRSSSKGSSTVSSQVSSPSSAPSSGYQDAWDTLYAAAGEVVRLKMNEEKKASAFSSERASAAKVVSPGVRGHYGQQSRPSGQLAGRSTGQSTRRKEGNVMAMNQAQQNWASKCAAMNAMASGGQSHCSLYQQYQQGYNLDSQQGVNTFYHPGKFADNKGVQRSRQSVMNGPGSGVRVVFLGGSSGRESGTGVFLPRSFEPKKKNDVASSNGPSHGCGSGAARQARVPREGVWPTLQQSMNRSAVRQAVHEPCLPTEWTY